MCPKPTRPTVAAAQRVAPADRRVVGGRGPLVPAQRGVLGQKARRSRIVAASTYSAIESSWWKRVGHTVPAGSAATSSPVHAGRPGVHQPQGLAGRPIAGAPAADQHVRVTRAASTALSSPRSGQLYLCAAAGLRQLGAQRRQVRVGDKRSHAVLVNCGVSQLRCLSSPVSAGAVPSTAVRLTGGPPGRWRPDDQVGGQPQGARRGPVAEAARPSSSRLRRAGPGRSGSRCGQGGPCDGANGMSSMPTPKGPRTGRRARGRRRSRRGPPGRWPITAVARRRPPGGGRGAASTVSVCHREAPAPGRGLAASSATTGRGAGWTRTAPSPARSEPPMAERGQVSRRSAAAPRLRPRRCSPRSVTRLTSTNGTRPASATTSSASRRDEHTAMPSTRPARCAIRGALAGPGRSRCRRGPRLCGCASPAPARPETRPNTGFAMSGTTTAIVAWSRSSRCPSAVGRLVADLLANHSDLAQGVRADPVGIAECTGSRGQRTFARLANVGQGRPHGTSSVDADTHRAAPCASLSRNWKPLQAGHGRGRTLDSARRGHHVAGVLELTAESRAVADLRSPPSMGPEFNDHTDPAGRRSRYPSTGRPCRSERAALLAVTDTIHGDLSCLGTPVCQCQCPRCCAHDR